MAECRLCGARGLELIEIDEDQWELVDPVTYEGHHCPQELAATGRVILPRAPQEEEALT